ncbi:MAG TPA: hypothetical protein VLJ83_10670, partial [Gemmatimonadaceae bacterium]|nr:hypothetical protein [Gemmatimonadaceae bacterium]
QSEPGLITIPAMVVSEWSWLFCPLSKAGATANDAVTAAAFRYGRSIEIIVRKVECTPDSVL